MSRRKVPVKHGQWKEDPSGYGFWICSACGFVSEASAADMLYKFCPVCGAKTAEEFFSVLGLQVS